MARQHVECDFAFLLAASRNDSAEKLLVARIVTPWTENEGGIVCIIFHLAHSDGPAAEDARQRNYVGLAIAAIDAQRMQLHQFARIVFVESFEAAFGLRRIGAAAEPVIEVVEHGRMMGDGTQQLAEIAEGIGANGILFVICSPVAYPFLAFKNIEVVKPEFGHDLLQLAWTF